MSEAPATSPPPAKKGKSVAVSKPQAKAAHPPTSEMVNSAIKELNERTGSSLQAIKKYISANYTVDPVKISPFIKKYLKNAVTNKKLIQTTGMGASGSFKLPAPSKEKSAAKKTAATKKPDVPKKTKAVPAEKEPKAKKVASPAKKKKPAAKSGDKKEAATTAKAAKSANSVKIVKSPKEKPTKPKAAPKKPKSPKKTAPAEKATTKKAAPKKK